MALGLDYDGKIHERYNRGQTLSMLPGSGEEVLIATWMERYCGVCMTTLLVNEYRHKYGKQKR